MKLCCINRNFISFHGPKMNPILLDHPFLCQLKQIASNAVTPRQKDSGAVLPERDRGVCELEEVVQRHHRQRQEGRCQRKLQ